MYEVKKMEIPALSTRYRRYPFFKMEIGDGFEAEYSEIKRIQVASWRHGRKHGMTFTTRKNGDICVCIRIA